MRDMILKEEYADFLDWTQLARLRPEQRIELSALGGYLDLINHINTHRYYMARERSGPVSAEEAVASWYDHVYMPVVEAIRRHNLLRSFPGRTEADLYLWIMQHRHSMKESAGADPGPEAAVLDYAQRYRPRSVLGTVGEAAQALASATRAATQWDESPALEALDFVQWSHIDTLCPGVEIRLTDLADYQRLRSHIAEHQYNLGTRWHRAVSLEEAVRDWCTNYYKPVVEAIRDRHLQATWPGHTEADLYLEAMDQLAELNEHGETAGLTEAVDSLQVRRKTMGKARLTALLASARRLLGRDTP
jgi:hypothetical protein